MLVNAGPKYLLILGLIIGLPGVTASVMFPPGGQFSLVHMMAPLLFAFGCFKGALAADTILLRQNNPEAAAKLEAYHGSAKAVSGWIVYKLAAAAMAFIGATVCLVLSL